MNDIILNFKTYDTSFLSYQLIDLLYRTKPKDLPNIPLGFSKMMKINPPPKMVKLFNEHQVLKLFYFIIEINILKYNFIIEII